MLSPTSVVFKTTSRHKLVIAIVFWGQPIISSGKQITCCNKYDAACKRRARPHMHVRLSSHNKSALLGGDRVKVHRHHTLGSAYILGNA